MALGFKVLDPVADDEVLEPA